MKITLVPVTPFQQNCTVLRCETTGQGAVVDPGGDLDRILAAIDEAEIQPVKIFLTHGHADHAAAAPALATRFRIPIEGPQREDLFWLQALPEQCRMFGLPPAAAFTPDRWLEDGDTVRFGNETLEVLYCPGHTPGHVVFFHRGERIAWVGDVLFQGSIGRTDFPRGDPETLLRSIRERLLPLGDDVVFIPGHGPTSTFGEERQTNPFLKNLGEISRHWRR